MSSPHNGRGRAEASGPAIAVEGLQKRFDTVTALSGIDFEVAPATVLGLLGPNGAGKTTAVRILTTIEFAARALREADIPVSDLGLRRPTLDDVFLTLTGVPASEDGDQQTDEYPAGERETAGAPR